VEYSVHASCMGVVDCYGLKVRKPKSWRSCALPCALGRSDENHRPGWLLLAAGHDDLESSLRIHAAEGWGGRHATPRQHCTSTRVDFQRFFEVS
jgi:hypothetical protein